MADRKQRLTREQRADRDQRIYRMHLAGASYRDIARATGLTGAAVHKVVRHQLALATDVREDLDADAEVEQLERMDTLLATQYPKALKGDPRAAEFCRRMLGDIARIKGLNSSVAERVAPSRIGDVDDSYLDDDQDDGPAVMKSYRQQRATEYEDEGSAAWAERVRRLDVEKAEARRRGVDWCELTADDRRRLHVVRDAG